MGVLEKAFPIAKVAVTKAVFGNTNENQVIEKIIRPGPMAERLAKVAMKKKKMASLFESQPKKSDQRLQRKKTVRQVTYPHNHRQAKSAMTFTIMAESAPSP